MAFARFKARGFVDLQVTERLFEKVLVAIPLALLLPLQPQSLGIFSREPETRVVFGQRLLESVIEAGNNDNLVPRLPLP